MIDVARLAQDVQRYVKREVDKQAWLKKLVAWSELAQPTGTSEALTTHLNHRVHHMYDEFSPYVVHPTLLHAFHQREEQRSKDKQRLETDIVQNLKPLLKQGNQASLGGSGGSLPLKKPNVGGHNQSGGLPLKPQGPKKP